MVSLRTGKIQTIVSNGCKNTHDDNEVKFHTQQADMALGMACNMAVFHLKPTDHEYMMAFSTWEDFYSTNVPDLASEILIFVAKKADACSESNPVWCKTVKEIKEKEKNLKRRKDYNRLISTQNYTSLPPFLAKSAYNTFPGAPSLPLTQFNFLSPSIILDSPQTSRHLNKHQGRA